MDKLKKSVIWYRRAKCAGSSIKKSLEDKDILKMWQSNNNFIDKSKILLVPGRNFGSFIETNLDFFNESFKFSVIRNPWDKFISSWVYCNNKDNFFGNKTIKEVLLNLPSKETHSHHYWHLTKPQSSILVSNGKVNVDVLIRFENLQEDFNKLCDIIGIEKFKLPHLNKTTHGNYWEYFDAETTEIFMDKYGDDVKNFEYKF